LGPVVRRIFDNVTVASLSLKTGFSNRHARKMQRRCHLEVQQRELRSFLVVRTIVAPSGSGVCHITTVREKVSYTERRCFAVVVLTTENDKNSMLPFVIPNYVVAYYSRSNAIEGLFNLLWLFQIESCKVSVLHQTPVSLSQEKPVRTTP
jgi:hypothetical protein